MKRPNHMVNVNSAPQPGFFGHILKWKPNTRMLYGVPAMSIISCNWSSDIRIIKVGRLDSTENHLNRDRIKSSLKSTCRTPTPALIVGYHCV